MAIAIQSLGNSPCSISRGITGVAADGALRNVRVETAGAPAQTGLTGSNLNEVFWRKLCDAARILTGAQDDAALSGVSLANVFWLASRAGNTALEATLQGTYPNGRLLDLPFIENAASIVTDCGPEPIPPQWGVVIFETHADGPRFADFRFVVSVDGGQTDSGLYMVKLFHSLTA